MLMITLAAPFFSMINYIGPNELGSNPQNLNSAILALQHRKPKCRNSLKQGCTFVYTVETNLAAYFGHGS